MKRKELVMLSNGKFLFDSSVMYTVSYATLASFLPSALAFPVCFYCNVCAKMFFSSSLCECLCLAALCCAQRHCPGVEGCGLLYSCLCTFLHCGSLVMMHCGKFTLQWWNLFLTLSASFVTSVLHANDTGC